MTPVTANLAPSARASDTSVDPVREFYAAHPYPPPVQNLDRARDEWRDPNRRRAEYHLFWPHRAYRTDLDILVAGCGTWQAAKYALCHPDARVVGIDISPTSLVHTERLKQQYELANLEIHQTSIEDAAALGQHFDLVVCTGVLHHLADPDAGLRALRSVMRPHGALYAMVYAPYGRIGISMIQDYCRMLGIGTSPLELDDLLSTLDALPHHHPLATALHGSRDKASVHALADALLNPRDRAYSVAQIFEWLERNGCRFGRWHSQAPYLSECGAISATPHAARLQELPVRDRYEAMELWRGTMTTHSFVAYRDHSECAGRVRWDDGRWRGYVPVRTPFTLSVCDRLPEGAAAVLLNRNHAYADLILPVTPKEKSVVDAIDGRRSISEIVTPEADIATWSRIRRLFERLWNYDQVVFDTSRGT